MTWNNLLNLNTGFRESITLDYLSGSGTNALVFNFDNYTGSVLSYVGADAFLTLNSNTSAAFFNPVIAYTNGSNQFVVNNYNGILYPSGTIVTLNTKAAVPIPSQNRLEGGLTVAATPTETNYVSINLTYATFIKFARYSLVTGITGTAAGSNTFTCASTSDAQKFTVGTRVYYIFENYIPTGTFVTSVNTSTRVVTLSKNFVQALSPSVIQVFSVIAGAGTTGTNTFTCTTPSQASAFSVGFLVENSFDSVTPAVPPNTVVVSSNTSTGVVTLSNNLNNNATYLQPVASVRLTVYDRFGVASTQYAIANIVNSTNLKFRWVVPSGVYYVYHTDAKVTSIVPSLTIDATLFDCDLALPPLSGTSYTYTVSNTDSGSFYTGARVTPSTFDAAFSTGATLRMRVITNSPVAYNTSASTVLASVASGGAGVTCQNAANTRAEATRRDYVSGALSADTVNTGSANIAPTNEIFTMVGSGGITTSSPFSSGATTATASSAALASLLVYGTNVRPTLSSANASSTITGISGTTITVAPGFSAGSSTLYPEVTVSFTSGSRVATVTQGLSYVNIGSVFFNGTGSNALDNVEVVRQPSGTNTIVLSSAPASTGVEKYVLKPTYSSYNNDVFISTMVVAGDSTFLVDNSKPISLTLTVGGTRTTTPDAGTVASVASLRNLSNGVAYTPSMTNTPSAALAHTFSFTPSAGSSYTACGNSSESSTICVSVLNTTSFNPVIDPIGCTTTIANAPTAYKFYPTTWFGTAYSNITWSATSTTCDVTINSITVATSTNQNMITDGTTVTVTVTLNSSVQIWNTVGGVQQTLPLNLYDRFNNTFYAIVNSNSNVLTIVNGSTVVGAVLSNANIPVGTVVTSITGNAVVMSANATASAFNAQVTFAYAANVPMTTASASGVTSVQYQTTWSNGGVWYLTTTNSGVTNASVASSYALICDKMHFKGTLPTCTFTDITINEQGAFRFGALLKSPYNGTIVIPPTNAYLPLQVGYNGPVQSASSASFSLYNYVTESAAVFSPSYSALESAGAMRGFRYTFPALSSCTAALTAQSVVMNVTVGSAPAVNTILSSPGYLTAGTYVTSVSTSYVTLSSPATNTNAAATVNSVAIWDLCDNAGTPSYSVSGESYTVITTAYVPGAGASGTSIFTCSTPNAATLFRKGTYVTSDDGSVPADTTVTAIDTGANTVTVSANFSTPCTKLYPEMRLTLTRYDNRIQCSSGCVGYLGFGAKFNVAVGHPLYGLYVTGLDGNYALLNSAVSTAVTNPYNGVRLQDSDSATSVLSSLTLPTMQMAVTDVAAQSGSQLAVNGQTVSATASFWCYLTPSVIPSTYRLRVDPNASYVAGSNLRISFAQVGTINTTSQLTLVAVNPGSTNPSKTITYSTTNSTGFTLDLCYRFAASASTVATYGLCGNSYTPVGGMNQGVAYSGVTVAPTTVSSITLASSGGSSTVSATQTMTNTVAFSDVCTFPMTQLVGYVSLASTAAFTLYNSEGASVGINNSQGFTVNAVNNQTPLSSTVSSVSATSISVAQPFNVFGQRLLASIVPSPSNTVSATDGFIKMTFALNSTSATVVYGSNFLKVGAMIYSRYIEGGDAQITAVSGTTVTLSMKATTAVSSVPVLTAYAYADVFTTGQSGYVLPSNYYVKLTTTHPSIAIGSRLFCSDSTVWTSPSRVMKYGSRFTMSANASGTSDNVTIPINTSPAPVSITFTNGSSTAMYNYTSGPFFVSVGSLLTSASYVTGTVTVASVTKTATGYQLTLQNTFIADWDSTTYFTVTSGSRPGVGAVITSWMGTFTVASLVSTNRFTVSETIRGNSYQTQVQFTVAAQAIATGTDTNVTVSVGAEVVNTSPFLFVFSGNLEVGWSIGTVATYLPSASYTISSFNNLLARMTAPNQKGSNVLNTFLGFPQYSNFPTTMSQVGGAGALTFDWMQTRFENTPTASSLSFRQSTSAIANTARFVARLQSPAVTLDGVSYLMRPSQYLFSASRSSGTFTYSSGTNLVVVGDIIYGSVGGSYRAFTVATTPTASTFTVSQTVPATAESATTFSMMSQPTYNSDGSMTGLGNHTSDKYDQHLYMDTGNITAFTSFASDMRTTYTVNWWMKPTSYGVWISPFGFGSPSSNQSLGCNMWQNSVAPGWGVVGAGTNSLIIGHLWFNADDYAYDNLNYPNASAIDTTKYHMITLTWDGTYRRTYFDGALFFTSGTISAGPNFTGQYLYLYRFLNSATYGIQNTMGDFRMWSTALSLTEISAMYADGMP